ncbi:hypothetical protein E0L93_08825 [Rubrobacter taiwanensis]|jgi:hypothetical protein|uniref:Uncharacterized protein n=1 Tax=Rubrobacter taiwanensis TaxID=185139 RepID=A0A4R1BHQ3_9ACTN|nr:hypothetical protein [Rubrobacter taiwanensis]TCJ16815.1 hypothetical protein E0L93_08825 [Rubrobacter taiwanensis]
MEQRSRERLTSAEVDLVLRRAAELSARRKDQEYTVSADVLVQVAAAAGIRESDVRRALAELRSDRAEEPESLAGRLYGPSRFRAVREIERPADAVREHLEALLRQEQGLKLRRKTAAGSFWDAGDLLGMVRRALDFSGHRPLLKAHSVELRIEEVEDGRCRAGLTADVSNLRSENLQAGGILGATFASLFAIAGFADALFFLGVLPALAAPAVGFRFAYHRASTEIRRALDALLDAAEEGPPPEEGEERRENRGPIRAPNPIPRFSPGDRSAES